MYSFIHNVLVILHRDVDLTTALKLVNNGIHSDVGESFTWTYTSQPADDGEDVPSGVTNFTCNYRWYDAVSFRTAPLTASRGMCCIATVMCVDEPVCNKR